MLVAGARPNFMKIAPIIRAIDDRKDKFQCCLVHTGQHYDKEMSDVFFEELNIPKPKYELSVGSGSHAVQTAKIMTLFEPVCEAENPDCVVVVGDVNSTLACSIVTKKLNIKLAHVEAGLRSGDMGMPEEINRVVTDSITDYYFVTENSGVENLIQEGKSRRNIFLVGHVMIDNLLFEAEKLDDTQLQDSLGFQHKNCNSRFGVVTLHRPSNVDDPVIFRRIMEGLSRVAEELPLYFPAHPRTQAKLRENKIVMPNSVTLMEPLGYREFLALWKNASVVLTDSGGLQEETTALGVPCLTLRENTERPVTIEQGTNHLVGSDPNLIYDQSMKILNGSTGLTRIPPLWDGKASARILDELEHLFLTV